MNHKFVSGICGSFAAVLAMTLTIQAPPQQGGGGGFGGGGFGGGIAGEIKNGEEVTQKLILTPGQPSEWELDIKSGDTIFVTVTTTNFDPEAQIVDAEGNVLGENDDIVLGDQRSRLVYTFDKEGKYKILVDGFESKEGGQYELTLRKFQSESIEINGSFSAKHDKADARWLRFDAGQDSRLLFWIDGNYGSDVSFFDPLGNKIEDPPMAFGSSGRRVLSPKLDGTHFVRFISYKDVPVEYGVSQNQTSQINKSIGRIEFEINDRQMRTFQLDASQFDLLQIDSSFDQEGVYVYAGDVDLPQSVSASGKETGDIDLIWRAKKNLKRSTYVAEEDATVSITFFGRTREPASHFLSVMPAGKPLIVDGSVIGNLNVGHYDIWTFAGTVGEVVQLDAIAERFDIELSVFYQDGNRSFSGEDRSSSDLNATAKNVIFESGHYIVVASCFGDGGGGSYSLEHAAKQTPRIEFEQELEFEVQGDSSSFFAFNGKKGQSVVISIETEANTWIELLWKSEYSIQEAYEIGGGQHVLAHRLPEDGTYTISVYGVETGKYKMKLVDIGFNQP